MTFLRSLPPYGPEREAHVRAAIDAGRITPPRWYRLRMGRVEVEVSRDYLAIDGERCPMSAPNAQAAVDSLDALLPTPAIVDAIEAEPAAIVAYLPTRPPSGDLQTSAEWIDACEAETASILAGIPGSDTALLAGHRKDVVVAPVMRAGRVAIYGARWKTGGRIQPLSSVHEAAYHDYSHAVRAVRRDCLLDGKPARLDDVLRAGLCGGPVAFARYPRPAEPPPEPTISAVLRRGDRGAAVVELQTLLCGNGHPVAIDGSFGNRTLAAVIAFQAGAGLVVDGLVGPRTLAALRADGLPDTEPTGAPLLEGTDVSIHNPIAGVPWSHFRFAFVRASSGLAEDRAAVEHLARAHASGVALLGAYHYLRGDRDGAPQAEIFAARWRAAEALVGPLAIALDLEDLPQPAAPWAPHRYRDTAHAFLARVRDVCGRPCAIYGSPSYLHDLDLDAALVGPLWAAHWRAPAPRVPRPWSAWTVHQYDVRERLDRNRFRGDAAAWRRAFGLEA